MIKDLKNLHDFEEIFPDEKSAIDHFRALRWPAGVCCPACGSMKVYDLKMGRHKCGEKQCAERFTVRNGTIFEDSKLSLRKWFKAVFLMTSHKKGISSCQLAKDVGVTQKTAWFMLHRIRNASMTSQFQAPLTGTIEADEMYVGGQSKWKHASKRVGSGLKGKDLKGKRGVLGLLQRDGELRLTALRGAKGAEFRGLLIDNIAAGSTVHTDEAAHYKWMASGYAHALVKHSLGEYVRDDVTTNRIEGAFGHFKRAVHGVYHKVSDEHLDRYVQCFAWRWNRRKMGEGERVNELLKATKGKRITYKQLIARPETDE